MSATDTPCPDHTPDPDRKSVIMTAFNALDHDLYLLRGHLEALLVAAEEKGLSEDTRINNMFWSAHAAALDVITRCETRALALWREVDQ